jgi:hypothetical protein
MRNFISITLAVVFGLFLFTTPKAYADRFETLYAIGNNSSSSVLTVEANEKVIVLSQFTYYASAESSCSLNLKEANSTTWINILHGRQNLNENFTIDGPCELKVTNTGTTSSGQWIRTTLKIITQSNDISPSNYATVIPENSQTDVNVILEQSTDLVNWTAVAPGQFNPSTNKRFFRVRSTNVPVTVTAASNASPVVLTSTGHNLKTGDIISVSGVVGNLAANGVFTITKVDANTFILNGTTGNGAYVSGGTWLPNP